MPAIKLIANPTFEAEVLIPVHGGEDAPVKFVFKHRTKKELKKWQNDLKKKDDAVVILEIIESWEFDDDVTKEAAETLVENYSGAAVAILQVYLTELAQAKLKN